MVIEFMGDDFGGQRKISGHGQLAQSQGGFEVADAFFHAAIVAGKTGWIVQGQHAAAGHDLIHVLVVERRAVVATGFRELEPCPFSS
jgi:hypothetical protein